jgi:hypothetical protein
MRVLINFIWVAVLSARNDLHKGTCDREDLALSLFGVLQSLHVARTEVISLTIFEAADVALCEWSEWDERHGRLRREVTVERGESCRDTN